MATYDYSKLDDAIFALGTDKVYPLGGLCDEVSTDSVDEGDIGLLRMTADRKLYIAVGAGAADLGKNEDAAHVSGDRGVMMLGVRNDFVNVLTDNDEDYSPLSVDQFGAIFLSSSGAPLNITPQKNEDSAHASGDSGIPVWGVRNDSGATVRTGSNQDYSPISTDSRGRVWTDPNFESRSDTYTTAVSGTTVDCSTFPVKYFSVQVTATGTVTSWDVRLEVSLNGANFTTLITHTNAAPGDGATVNYVSPFPARYFRSRCAGIVLGVGTNVITTIVGMN